MCSEYTENEILNIERKIQNIIFVSNACTPIIVLIIGYYFWNL